MLLVQEYLLTHSFADLAKEFGVYASFSKSGHKFSLNYGQIESRESDLLSQQCRGLILAHHTGRSFLSEAIEVNGRLNYDHIVLGNSVIVAHPMNRFFNYGQGAAADINWSDPNIQILEKLDGTCIILYEDIFTNEWCVATRSVPEADIPIDGGAYTFRTLFEKALMDTCGKSFNEFIKILNKDITYCFELTSPINRIVVDYKEFKITLLSARSKTTGKEINIKDIDIGIPHVHAYEFMNINDLINWVSTKNPLEHEGVVVRDSNFNRIKVKNASYVAFNRARDILGTSERNCLELVLQGKEDDVIPALPTEIVDRILKIKSGLIKVINKYDSLFKEIKILSDQKESGNKKIFAMQISESKDIWAAPMYNIFDGKATDMKDYIQKQKKEGTWANNILDKILSEIKKSDNY